MGVYYSEKTKRDKIQNGALLLLLLYVTDMTCVMFCESYTCTVDRLLSGRAEESLPREVEILSNTLLVNFSNYSQRSLCSHGDPRRDFRHHNPSLPRLPSQRPTPAPAPPRTIYARPLLQQSSPPPVHQTSGTDERPSGRVLSSPEKQLYATFNGLERSPSFTDVSSWMVQ